MVQFSRGVGFGIARNLEQTNQNIQTVLSQLSSAKRLTSFSVDASGGSLATKLESAYRGLNEQIRAEEDRVSMMRVQESGYSEITDGVQRIRELQVQSGNATLGAPERQAIQAEIDQLAQGIQEVLDTTGSAGAGLLEAGSELQAFLAAGPAATGDLATTDRVLEEVTSQRSAVGANINAATNTISNLQVAFENTVATYSRIADMDVAQGITQLTNKEMLQQMTMGTLKNFMNINRQKVLGLIGTLGG